jgi:hypothetical protein
MDFSDIVRRADIMFSPLRNLDPDLAAQLTALDFDHISVGTVPGQEERTKSAKSPDMARAAHNFLRYSPESPMGRGALIETNWVEAEPHVADWEKDHGGSATQGSARNPGTLHQRKTGNILWSIIGPCL